MRSSEQTWSNWLLWADSSRYLLDDMLPDCFSGVTKHLVLLRERGRLLLWGFLTLNIHGPKFENCTGEERGHFEYDGTLREDEGPDQHIEQYLSTSRLEIADSAS